MEKSSYAEMLHDIFVQYGYKDRVTPFETSVILLIEKMLGDNKSNAHDNIIYDKNNEINSNCDSCARHNNIIGCDLKSKDCIKEGKYTKYRRVHLLPCEKCRTYSVVTKIDKIVDKNTGNILKPIIYFMCLKCNNHPVINGYIFKGFDLKGLRLTSRYLKIYKSRTENKENENKENENKKNENKENENKENENKELETG